MTELTKVKLRILARIENFTADMEKTGALINGEKIIIGIVKDIINEEFDKATPSNIEQIIKDTIKEYIDKDYSDTTELLLDLSHDLCERIRKETTNGF